MPPHLHEDARFSNWFTVPLPWLTRLCGLSALQYRLLGLALTGAQNSMIYIVHTVSGA
jgi:hypothetical protein